MTSEGPMPCRPRRPPGVCSLRIAQLRGSPGGSLHRFARPYTDMRRREAPRVALRLAQANRPSPPCPRRRRPVLPVAQASHRAAMPSRPRARGATAGGEMSNPPLAKRPEPAGRRFRHFPPGDFDPGVRAECPAVQTDTNSEHGPMATQHRAKDQRTSQATPFSRPVPEPRVGRASRRSDVVRRGLGSGPGPLSDR